MPFLRDHRDPDAGERLARELILNNWPKVLMITAALLEHEVLDLRRGVRTAGALRRLFPAR